MLKIFCRAIIDSFTTSLFLVFSMNFVQLMLDFEYYFPCFLMFIIIGALLFAFRYLKIINMLSTIHTLVIFSLISFLSFFIFWIVFLVIDIYFPSVLSPPVSSVRSDDVSDGVGVIFANACFLIVNFAGRLVAFIRRLLQLKKRNNQGTVL